jgi:catechol 2,3-dioxygenase-like lactoylglutathione lyase family enzyme
MSTDQTPAPLEAESAPNVKQAVPFFAVTDIEASLRFYLDGLGFEMTNKWIDEGKLRWCWLQIGDAALMLQEIWKEGPHARTLAGELGAGVTICFLCKDALAIFHEAKSRGIKATTPFVGNGMWVTTVTDPDGYRLDFESVTDVPEDTVYADVEG